MHSISEAWKLFFCYNGWTDSVLRPPLDGWIIVGTTWNSRESIILLLSLALSLYIEYCGKWFYILFLSCHFLQGVIILKQKCYIFLLMFLTVVCFTDQLKKVFETEIKNMFKIKKKNKKKINNPSAWEQTFSQ